MDIKPVSETAATRSGVIAGVLADVVACHPMWIGDDGEDLDYLPERETRIADFVDECAERIDQVLGQPLTSQYTQVLADVAAERDKQIAKGYTPEHDDLHTPAEIAAFGGLNFGPIGSRERLIRMAACLVAAIERLDRQEQWNPKSGLNWSGNRASR